MTTNQISAILAELNDRFEGMYTEDTWLEANEISSIILSSDESVYPDETMQIKFDQTNELLLTRVGKYNSEGTFEVIKNTAAISYELIIGFNMRRIAVMKSPYKIGASV
jgi:hypothetical protein